MERTLLYTHSLVFIGSIKSRELLSGKPLQGNDFIHDGFQDRSGVERSDSDKNHLQAFSRTSRGPRETQIIMLFVLLEGPRLVRRDKSFPSRFQVLRTVVWSTRPERGGPTGSRPHPHTSTAALALGPLPVQSPHAYTLQPLRPAHTGRQPVAGVAVIY